MTERKQDVLLIGTGISTRIALDCAKQLEKKAYTVKVLHFHTLKPIDVETLRQAIQHSKIVITIEEHGEVGGLGSVVGEEIAKGQGCERFIRWVENGAT